MHLPELILRDLNASLMRLRVAMELLMHHGWVDEARDEGVTCLASNSRNLTRRDYILACPLAHQLVIRTKVSYVGTFATHHILQARLRPKKAFQKVDRLRTHTMLADTVDTHIESVTKDMGDKEKAAETKNKRQRKT